MPYYAHIRQDENGQTIYQTVAEHLTGTAALCREFAADFGAEADGDLMGLAPDLGKCTDAFQKRLLEGGPVVDHTMAGMLTCIKMKRRVRRRSPRRTFGCRKSEDRPRGRGHALRSVQKGRGGTLS